MNERLKIKVSFLLNRNFRSEILAKIMINRAGTPPSNDRILISSKSN